MAGSDMSDPQHDPSNHVAVADYLAAVAGPAAGASLARLTLAGRAARRCLATRAALS